MYYLIGSDISDYEYFQNDLNSPPTEEQETNNNVQSSSNNSSSSVQCIKRKRVQLTEKQLQFRKQFFAILTHRKILRKEIVKGIHDEFLVKNIEGLTEMTRDEFRSINLYFINRIDYQDKIYKVLKEHKDKISEKYLRY
ncbi:hypothetical protein M9Y10_034701 [Tritrichomonas musculus]|uniref:Uncharacterized protein n=1 Tax=Tritrichomonas musculus TaxID=1915356 RepID=A0ABR2KFQ5_9EUKA